jgi:hypothetical protein
VAGEEPRGGVGGREGITVDHVLIDVVDNNCN